MLLCYSEYKTYILEIAEKWCSRIRVVYMQEVILIRFLILDTLRHI